MSGKNYLEMSDEDFGKLPELVTGVTEEVAPTPVVEPPVAPLVEEQVSTEVQTPVIEPTTEEQAPPVEKTDEEIQAEADALASKPQETEEEKKTREEKEASEAAAAAELTPEQKAAADKAAEEAAEAGERPDYEAFYKQIIGPIKGGKKLIEIKTPEEAIKLMQMGAGFGRKMQEIQPHLKTLRFMEANGLLNVDQSDLAFLVDLKNKNPDAIKKLIKDSGIDPLDISNDEPVNYQTNIPEVTDAEVNFREALSDLANQEGGLETISIVEKTWDKTSHEALMKEPGLLSVIQAQRDTGIYDRIVTEMDRQKALGNIPYTTPFLEAYQQVGNHLRDTNGFADLVDKARQAEPPKVEEPKTVVQPQIIDTKVVAPKSSVSNNDKANAAASTRNSPKVVAPLVNPLSMSDEEFQKQFGTRF
jgi:hypothetical protein